MSTSFICRQCIARLTQPRSGRLKSKNLQLHTRAVSTLIPQPAWSSAETQWREQAVRHDIADDHEVQIPVLHSIPTPQATEDEPSVEQRPKWDGHPRIWKFTPSRRSDVAAVARRPVENSRDLMAKILGSLGNYRIVHKDLMTIYGLSHQEARHAVGQLGRLLWGRSRVEAGMRLESFNIWKNHFKELLQMVDSSPLAAKTDADPPRSNAWTDPKKEDLETVKDVWQRLSQQRREFLWPQMAINTFRSNPGAVPSFIQATFQPSWCPSYIVEDLVTLLFRTLDNIRGDQSKRRKVEELVFFLLEHCPPKYLVLEQVAIYKIASAMPISRLGDFYQTLKRVEHPLHPNTLLHFASGLAHKSEYKVQAADIIHSLSNVRGFDINSPAAASVCTTLLTVEEGDALLDGRAAPDELFKILLDAGFRPNLLNLSALMRNFCVRGRVEVAWNIFDILNQRGIEPDTHVFSILLNGSKHALHIESVQRIVSIIHARKGWSIPLVNDLLDYVYRNNESQRLWKRRQQKANSAQAWRLMVQVYSKFFDFFRLQMFTLFPLENLLAPKFSQKLPAHLEQVYRLVAALEPLPDVLLMRPNSVTLGLMLRAHLRSIHNPEVLQKYHLHFQKLLAAGNRTALKLVRDSGTMVYDTLIREFMQFRPTVQRGIKIVENMYAASKREKEKYGGNKNHPPPSVHTYNTLMNGLRNHNLTRGVLTTLSMMIREGLTPDIVTWNTVIGTLLRGDHLADAVKVMRYLEQIGLETDSNTAHEVARLNPSKRRRVALLMEKMWAKPVTSMDQRTFVESLLSRGVNRGHPQLSMKKVRKINRERREPERTSEAAVDAT